MTSDDERRLIVLAGVMSVGGSGSKKDVLDAVERCGLMVLSERDLRMRRSRKERVWRNELAYSRIKLVKDGWLSGSLQDQWAITPMGVESAKELLAKAKSESLLVHVNGQAFSVFEAVILPTAQAQLEDPSARRRTSTERGRGLHWTVQYDRNADASVLTIAGALFEPYRVADENIARSGSTAFTVDLDAVDRGLKGHAVTQNRLSQLLTTREGVFVWSPPAKSAVQFDLAWSANGHTCVAEIKSLFGQNEEQQLRLGLGQVLRYRSLLHGYGISAKPVLAVERPPKDLAWQAVCDENGVLLVWPENMEQVLTDAEVI